MTRSLFATLASTTFLVAAPLAAQDVVDLDAIIFSGGLYPIEEERYGRSASLISREEIEERGLTTVQDALRALPGVAVNSTGDSFTQVRIRGGEGNHVLVLIDGVEANVQGSGEYIFAGLQLDDVERIEVLRGPQSAIYGSNAMSGVISITTRGATNPGWEYGGGVEVGGLNTRAANAYLRYLGERGSLSFNFATRHTDGEDGSRSGGDTEFNDRETISLRGDYQVTDAITIGFTLRRTWQEFGYDSAFSVAGNRPIDFIVDAPLTADRNEFYGAIFAEAETFGGRMVNRLTFSGMNYDMTRFNAGVFSSDDAGTRRKAALTGSIALDTGNLDDANHRLSYVLEAERETYRSFFSPGGRFERNTRSIALEYQGDFASGFSVQAGLRHDFNDVFDDATTWSVSGSYQIPGQDIRLRAAAGRAIVNPTMFEQFGFIPGVFTGNPNLKPEDSLGYEVGVDFDIADRGTIGVTYFNNDVKNLIVGFGPTATNVPGTSTRRGVEVSFDVGATDWLHLGGAYTYTKATDAAGTPLARRPKHELGLRATADLFDGRGSGTIDIRHVAGNYDLDWYRTVWPAAPSVLEMPAFTTVNLSMTYDLTDNLELTGRVVNLTDSDASEAWGYYGQGRTFYVGLNSRW